MLPLYEETGEEMHLYKRHPHHVSPHLHNSIEMVYLTEGSVALGIGEDLYAMGAGDFAIIFPGLIHHYQNFGDVPGTIYHLLVSPSMCGRYYSRMQQSYAASPVIKKEDQDPDIPYVMKRLMKEYRRLDDRRKGEAEPGSTAKDREAYLDEDQDALDSAYAQVLIARALPMIDLKERKSEADESDLVTLTVTYIAANFREPVTLTGMAHELGVSQYTLSRIFSSTFHCNFNTYLNDARLNYAVALLENTDQPITDICYNSGFESQRTFNRVFKERYHVTPAQYRKGSIITE